MISADIMSRCVITVSRDAPLTQAIRLMIDRRVSGLPVTDAAGRLVGILTEGDLLRRVEIGTEGQVSGWFAKFFALGRVAGHYVQTHGRHVSEVMTPTVISVEERTPLSDIVALMRRHRIKRLPVVRDGVAVGIVSRADLVRIIGDALDAPAATADDAAIRQAIVTGLTREPWARNKVIGFSVECGVVLLDGYVFDMRERAAIAVLAENVPGVKRVENRLLCIEPNSGMVLYGPDDEIDSTAPINPRAEASGPRQAR
jgi:CBS domain-containing protein